MISIKRLDKTFNRGKQNAIHVVNDVSLELPESGMVAIFGRSGCGKTTLLNVIGGLDRVESGSVEIDREKMSVSNDALRNRSIGYIFQNYLLHRDKTCYENVADALRLLGVSDRTFIEKQVDAALRAVGMERFASRMPDTLSGGQQQRIAIARAIVKNPPVVLADEPTGNLDEANTLRVMRLLKAISRDRLVLLVTHEENLVAAFSDRVIELSDGRVVSDRANSPTEGFSVRDKNAVYLGELPHKTLSDGGVTLDLYGEAPVPEVKLRLARTEDGRVYLKVDAGKVSVLDETSETRFETGAAPKNDEQKDAEDLPDLSGIKPVKGARPGRLFGFADAWRGGIRANLGKQKRGRKVLRNALILFAAVVVFMTASLGVFVRNLLDVDATYHHHLIYAYAGDEESATALSALGADEGVNYRQIVYGNPSDRSFSFNAGSFETFTGGGSFYMRVTSTVNSTGVAFLRSAATGRSLLAGKNAGLADDDALISEGFAKALLNSATVDYLKSYDDLIGTYSDDGDYRIAGIVSGDDREIYLSAARWLSESGSALYVPSMLDGFSAPADGMATVILPYVPDVPSSLPVVGGTVFVNGKALTVDRVIRRNETYAAWCGAMGYDLPVLSDPPTFAEAEAYLAHYSDFLTEKAAVFGDPDLATLLSRSGIRRDALYWANPTDGTVRPALVLLAYRSLWNETHTGSPTEADVREWAETMNDPEMNVLYEIRQNEFIEIYSDLFYELNYSGKGKGARQSGFLLNEKEAEAALSRAGKTTILEGFNYYEASGSDGYNPADRTIVSDRTYLALRTNDPEKTAAAIEAVLGDHYRALSVEQADLFGEWLEPLYTPASFREEALRTEKGDIVANAIELAVFIAVMSLCMYLMMRASMMGRIREIGIYRAIGVSKKNLVFRFFVESLAVASLTVLFGYLFSSILISAWLAKVPLISSFFYYPLWMALASLALLYAISALCGTLPVLRLLRRTPSEILSKYDI